MCRARNMLLALDGLHLLTDAEVLDGLAEATEADDRAAAAWQEGEEQKVARRAEVETAHHRGDFVRRIVATLEPPRARDADHEGLLRYIDEVRARFDDRMESDPSWRRACAGRCAGSSPEPTERCPHLG